MRQLSRLETIRELSIRNGRSFNEVMNIYTRFDMRVVFDYVKKGKPFKLYSPEVEEEIFRRTERYFMIDDIRKLKRLNKYGSH